MGLQVSERASVACLLRAARVSGCDFSACARAMGKEGRLLVGIRVAGHARVRGEAGGLTRTGASDGARGA